MFILAHILEQERCGRTAHNDGSQEVGRVGVPKQHFAP